MRVTIVGHTDSRSLAAIGRLERLGIIDLFDVIYCQMKHEAEHPLAERRLHWDQLFSRVMIKELPKHEKKPDPQVLRDILQAEQFLETECVFIGDSKSRDILMAKKANVFAAWARYGAWHDKDVYERLIAISHWTEREVDEELAYSAEAKQIQPDFIVERFEEILPLYRQGAISAA
jgi:FMN phosphatase YigB (HAD superfamily)